MFDSTVGPTEYILVGVIVFLLRYVIPILILVWLFRAVHEIKRDVAVLLRRSDSQGFRDSSS
jgi:hypothetical protein